MIVPIITLYLLCHCCPTKAMVEINGRVFGEALKHFILKSGPVQPSIVMIHYLSLKVLLFAPCFIFSVSF